MHLLGYSTGSLARGDVLRALEMLRPHSLVAVELSALREAELQPLLEALVDLPLGTYQHISVHAPSKLTKLSEREVRNLLLPLKARGWPVIVHPDIMKDIDLWRELGSTLCLENMDKRKPVGRTAKELDDLFLRLPDAKLCLDVGHSKQIDPSMHETREILSRHGGRLAQIHLSDVNSNCAHEPLNQLAIMAYQKVSHLLPEQVPVILESPVTESQLEAELDRARLVLSALTHA
jgi:hypothetical protein